MLPNYAHKMNEVRTDIVTMGEFALESLHLSLEAVKKGDTSMLDSARNSRLKHVGYLANGIDNNIVVALALYTPEASELRELIALLKSTNEMVRLGNAARSYAAGMEEAIREGLDISPFLPFIIELHNTAIRATEHLVAMLKSFSIEHYRAILVEEDKSDEIALLLQKEILDRLCENKDLVPSYLKVLRRVRKLEKAVDSAESIAKMLVYAKEGGKIEIN